MTPRGAASAVAAVLGIVSAAVLAWSVSRLVAERIGLSSAPPSVVQGLLPPPPGRGGPLPPRTEDPSGGVRATQPSPSSPAGPGAGSGAAAAGGGGAAAAGGGGAAAAGGAAAPVAGGAAPARSGNGGDSGGSDGGGGGGGGRDD